MRQSLHNKYSIPFAVLLCLALFSSCEKKSDSVIDPDQNAPTLLDAACSLTVVNTDTINVGPLRSPDDVLSFRGGATIRVIHPQGKNEISSVKYSITDQYSSVVGEGIFHDDGIVPDRFANDSIYSGYVQIQIKRVYVGNLFLSFWSENPNGQISNTILLPLSIVRLNHSPVISDLIAPSTINLVETNSFTITLKAIDADGSQDIKNVFRFTPSGKVLPLSPMNDTLYVETVSLVPAPAPGPYEFRFRAVDRSGDSSNVLTQTIVITNSGVIE